MLKRLHVTTQHIAQVLVQYKLCPDVTAVAKHNRKQPDLALHARFIVKRDLKLRKVHLRLLARICFKTHLKRCRWRGPNSQQEFVEDGFATRVALLANLAQQT